MNFILAIIAAFLFVLCGLKRMQSACQKSARGLFIASFFIAAKVNTSFSCNFSFETFLIQLQNYIFEIYNQLRIPAFRTVSLRRFVSMNPFFI